MKLAIKDKEKKVKIEYEVDLLHVTEEDVFNYFDIICVQSFALVGDFISYNGKDYKVNLTASGYMYQLN